MKSKKKHKIILIITFFILSNYGTYANDRDIQVSLNLGAGIGINNEVQNGLNILGLVNANVSFDKLLFSVRNVRMIEFIGSNYARDVALMTGYRSRVESNYLDISVGVAHNSGFKSEQENYYSNLGVALEISFFFIKRNKFSNGITLFANLNERSPFFGLTYTISVVYRNKK